MIFILVFLCIWSIKCAGIFGENKDVTRNVLSYLSIGDMKTMCLTSKSAGKMINPMEEVKRRVPRRENENVSELIWMATRDKFEWTEVVGACAAGVDLGRLAVECSRGVAEMVLSGALELGFGDQANNLLISLHRTGQIDLIGSVLGQFLNRSLSDFFDYLNDLDQIVVPVSGGLFKRLIKEGEVYMNVFNHLLPSCIDSFTGDLCHEEYIESMVLYYDANMSEEEQKKLARIKKILIERSVEKPQRDQWDSSGDEDDEGPTIKTYKNIIDYLHLPKSSTKEVSKSTSKPASYKPSSSISAFPPSDISTILTYGRFFSQMIMTAVVIKGQDKEKIKGITNYVNEQRAVELLSKLKRYCPEFESNITIYRPLANAKDEICRLHVIFEKSKSNPNHFANILLFAVEQVDFDYLIELLKEPMILRKLKLFEKSLKFKQFKSKDLTKIFRNPKLFQLVSPFSRHLRKFQKNIQKVFYHLETVEEVELFMTLGIEITEKLNVDLINETAGRSLYDSLHYMRGEGLKKKIETEPLILSEIIKRWILENDVYKLKKFISYYNPIKKVIVIKVDTLKLFNTLTSDFYKNIGEIFGIEIEMGGLMRELRTLPIEVFKKFMKTIYNDDKKVSLIEKFIVLHQNYNR